jgi:hypothetical protein
LKEEGKPAIIKGANSLLTDSLMYRRELSERRFH